MSTIQSARDSLVELGVNRLVSLAPTLLHALEEGKDELQESPPAHATLQTTQQTTQALREGNAALLEANNTERPPRNEKQQSTVGPTMKSTVATGTASSEPGNVGQQNMLSMGRVCKQSHVYEPEPVHNWVRMSWGIALKGINLHAATPAILE